MKDDTKTTTKKKTKKDTPPPAPPPEPPVAAAKITATSRVPGRLIINGAPSGKRYEFVNAGVSLEVDQGDVEFLRSRGSIQGGCCGKSRTELRKHLIINDGSEE